MKNLEVLNLKLQEILMQLVENKVEFYQGTEIIKSFIILNGGTFKELHRDNTYCLDMFFDGYNFGTCFKPYQSHKNFYYE